MNTENITHSPRFQDRKRNLAHRLSYYFSLIAHAAGVRWDGDNDAETREAADMIADMIDAATFATLETMRQEITQLENEISDLRREMNSHKRYDHN